MSLQRRARLVQGGAQSRGHRRYGVDVEVVSPFPPLLEQAARPRTTGRALCRCVDEWSPGSARPRRAASSGSARSPCRTPTWPRRSSPESSASACTGVEIGSTSRRLARRRAVLGSRDAQAGVPIFVHTLDPTFTNRLPGPAVFPRFGFATDIGLAAASLVTSGTTDKCPGLSLAFSHGAGGSPLMLTRAQYFWSGAWDEGLPPGGEPAGLLAGVSPHSPTEIAPVSSTRRSSSTAGRCATWST